MQHDKRISDLPSIAIADATNAMQFAIADASAGTNYRMSIETLIAMAHTLPTYADNAAAVSGGLAVGTLYKTATGDVRIVV
ncbi:MAG: hypothetical protein HC911_18015 [Chloroflexaceae bacterium]|nr:hypothetical protein [Chloroflexaceae bacterium]